MSWRNAPRRAGFKFPPAVWHTGLLTNSLLRKISTPAFGFLRPSRASLIPQKSNADP